VLARVQKCLELLERVCAARPFLDAAGAQVLSETGMAMTCSELIDAMTRMRFACRQDSRVPVVPVPHAPGCTGSQNRAGRRRFLGICLTAIISSAYLSATGDRMLLQLSVTAFSLLPN